MHYFQLFMMFFMVSKLLGQPSGDSLDPHFELEKQRLKILEENTVGKKYYFDFTGNKDCNQSFMCYLGEIANDEGVRYKVLTSFYVHGQSCRGTSRIVIYNSDHVYLGNYYVSLPKELPKKIRHNELVFARTGSTGNHRRQGRIAFTEGTPAAITFSYGRSEQAMGYLFSTDE